MDADVVVVGAGLAGLVATAADELIDRGIILNAVNPGPVDTGYCDPGEVTAALPRAFPQGRWGEPDDPARLIEWLASDAGRWEWRAAAVTPTSSASITYRPNPNGWLNVLKVRNRGPLVRTCLPNS